MKKKPSDRLSVDEDDLVFEDADGNLPEMRTAENDPMTPSGLSDDQRQQMRDALAAKKKKK